MTEYNFAWDGASLGKAGPYSSEDFARFAYSILGLAETENQGVLLTPNDGSNASLAVTQNSPAGKSVLVKEGAAVVNGRWYYTDADIQVTIPDNTDGSGFDRIDLLVLRSNSTTQTITPALIEGTPAGSPASPTPVRTGAIFDIELAEIQADNLFTTIVNADIDNTVKTLAPIWSAFNGGTGIAGGYTQGDGIRASGNDILEIIQSIGEDGGLIVEQNGSTPISIDTRMSIAYLASATGSALITNPVAIANGEDLAGNFRAVVSSSRFYPEAGLYRVEGWFTASNISTSLAVDNLTFFLYDTVAAAIVADINGSDVRSSGAYLRGNLQMNGYCYMSKDVIFDGTENIEIRPSVTQAGLTYANIGTITRPVFISLTRKG